MSVDTTRLALPKPELSDFADIALAVNPALEILDDAAVYFKGLLSALPSVGAVPDGTLYWATDAEVMYLSDGSSWNPIGGIGFRPQMPQARVVTSAGVQSIPNNVATSTPFGSEAYDDYGMHSGSDAFVTVLETGLYLVEARVSWAANATGYREVLILGNGVTVGGVQGKPVGGSDVDIQQAHALMRLTAGQTFEVKVRQTSGGALNCHVSGSDWLSAVMLSA